MKVNLCCGDDYRKDYINVDFSNKRSDGKEINVDMVHNVLEGLPFKDGEVDSIVFNEALEHFNRWNGQKVLKEIARVLKKGGILDLSVPNAKDQLQKLAARFDDELNEESFERAHQEWNYWKWHDDLMGGTRPSDGYDGDSHKTLYSTSALRSCIGMAGLKVVRVSVESSIFIRAIKA